MLYSRIVPLLSVPQGWGTQALSIHFSLWEKSLVRGFSLATELCHIEGGVTQMK